MRKEGIGTDLHNLMCEIALQTHLITQRKVSGFIRPGAYKERRPSVHGCGGSKMMVRAKACYFQSSMYGQ